MIYIYIPFWYIIQLVWYLFLDVACLILFLKPFASNNLRNWRKEGHTVINYEYTVSSGYTNAYAALFNCTFNLKKLKI